VGGVNYNDNCLDVTFNVEGTKVEPVIAPVDPFIQIDNRVTHGASPVWNFQFTGEDGMALSLTGTMPHTSKDPFFIPVPNPPMLYGTVLASRLAKAGIEVKGGVEASSQPKAAGFKPIATAQTPIAWALIRANKKSLNMMAECLFLRASAEPDSPATWEKAAKIAKSVLVNQYKIDEKLVTVADGSGLSRTNTVAPAALTTILLALQNEPDFFDSLPIGGIDGSLDKRFTKPPYRGRIVAKTGTLAGASALSGYVLDKTGKPAYVFSILVNGGSSKGMSAHSLQDAICEELIRSLDAEK
jgi:D-alanyl-D-alanine carboxypeptidase/D-alanyl-D-alanine-endopeptidase (penicillin-binding protein 4)